MKKVGPAIGLLELNKISRGFLVTDALLKKAPVELLFARPVSTGKFVVLFHGDEESVLESIREGRIIADTTLVDDLSIPNIHPQVKSVLNRKAGYDRIDALGFVEAYSVASGIVCADKAAKETDIHLIELRLGDGIGGKSILSLTGRLYDVQASLKVCRDYLLATGMLAGIEIIPAPHEDMVALMRGR